MLCDVDGISEALRKGFQIYALLRLGNKGVFQSSEFLFAPAMGQYHILACLVVGDV